MIRAAVKPFLVHLTAGHTSEIVTAHAVALMIGHLLQGEHVVIPAQVVLEGELGLHGVAGMTIRLSTDGWSEVVDPGLDDDRAAPVAALAAIDTLISLADDPID